jgi:hypothetical protein
METPPEDEPGQGEQPEKPKEDAYESDWYEVLKRRAEEQQEEESGESAEGDGDDA